MSFQAELVTMPFQLSIQSSTWTFTQASSSQYYVFLPDQPTKKIRNMMALHTYIPQTSSEGKVSLANKGS